MTEPIIIRSTDGVITLTDDISDVRDGGFAGLTGPVLVVDEVAFAGEPNPFNPTGEVAILPIAHIVKVTVPAGLADAVRSPEPSGGEHDG